MNISVLREKAVIMRVSAKARPTMLRAGIKYTAASLSITPLRPLMNFTEYRTALSGLFCGYLTSMNGTAAKLSFSDIQRIKETRASTAEFAAMNISLVPRVPWSME